MQTGWSPREKWASAAVGAIASIFLVFALFDTDTPLAFLPNLGVALGGFALAIAPHVLFQPFSIKHVKLQSSVLLGTAAILALAGNACFVIVAWSWLTGRTI